MGELSQRIGKKLEHYGNSIFEHLEWKILAQDVQIDCIRAAHKNAKSSDKKTHGVDILAGYYNPFTKRQEAFIIECKHREWSNFIPSNLSLWVEELCNTIECASTSPALTTYLEEYTLIGGILLYNSSDNIYEMERALKSISQIKVPRRRHPLMIYLADNSRLEKWYSFNAEIAKIKQNSIENSFGIIYPSIGGSTWDRSPVVTPTYLFSDYILASYIKSATNQGVTTKVDIKALFCFEHVTDDSLKYLQDMNFEQNNLKSTVVIISPKSEQSKEDFLTSIADEFVNKGRSSNTKYTLKNIARNQTSVTLQYIYKKPQKGRIKIAETRTVTLDVTISPLEDDSQKYKVSIRHEGMSESKQFVTLLDEMIQEDSEQAVFGLKRITLASLLKAHKVDFFDDFGVYTHKEWKLTDIINVTVNKDEKSIDDENDVTTSGEIDASEPSGRLSGISSAILKGDGLRNNDFVKECMSQGFIFSSMSYKFSHKTLPITIVIDVNFKQTDLKINIVKTYQLEDDGIERLAPLPSSDQSLYIDYFQNVAYAVYSNLIEKQKDELVKQTIKPEK